MRYALLLIYWRRFLRFQLLITKSDNMTSSRSGKDFRFAIVDLDKANEYPLNFVCRLPVNLNGIKSENSKFSQIFGRNNMEIAKKLLIEALDDEDDDDLKREVERRLKLLEP